MNQKNSIRQGLNLMKKKTYIYLLALVPFLIVAMLYEIVPLITVIVKSFQPDGGTGFTLENYQSVFSKLLYQKAIINSIKISLTSAVAGIIIAFLGARAAHQHQGKLNHVFMTVLNMVSNFAGIPLAFAYMILLGNAGLVVNIGKELGINALSTYNLYTMNGMSLIYIYFQIPLSTLLLRRIFRKPFSVMAASMHRIQEGNLEERICTEHMSDEFSTVSCIFNEMMDNIRDLKIKIYDEEINRQNETLVYLQMQVKPHFYLNSLNMIYTLARNNDIALIKDLSMSLIRYFRYMFNESTFVTLVAELEHIRNYLRIQAFRFPDSFDYSMEIDDTLRNACVPYLLIQNFVENSMKYAVSLDEKAELRILINPAGESHERFTIRIEDNGPGFPENVLDKIRNGEIIWRDDRKHLGIWNSCRRLHLLYHGTAKIEFENLRPHGALINITLPVNPPEKSMGKDARTGGSHEPVTC